MTCGVSMLAIRYGLGGVEAQTLAALWEAASEDEARGRGFRELGRKYPESDGWKHRVVVATEKYDLRNHQ